MQQLQLDQQGLAIEPGFIRVYNIDPHNGEYIGESEEYLAAGVGIPQHSFLDQPPAAKSGYAICRQDNQWQYVIDLRGQVCYSTMSREAKTISTLGELSSEWTLAKPATEHDKWNGSQWQTDQQARHTHRVKQRYAQKQQLDQQAKDEISRLSDAITFLLALPGDEEKLLAWRKYRVLLGQLDLNQPDSLQWPDLPQ